MKRKHLIYLILVLGVVVLLMGWLLSLTPFIQPLVQPFVQLAPATDGGSRTVQLDGNAISVTVADTDATRTLGLGGRTGLAADEGMLFVFPADGEYAFWMKDMKFSIDMVWISAGGQIVYMAQNVSPGSYPQTFVSPTPARYVLELPAGYAKQHGVAVGDTVQL